MRLVRSGQRQVHLTENMVIGAAERKADSLRWEKEREIVNGKSNILTMLKISIIYHLEGWVDGLGFQILLPN